MSLSQITLQIDPNRVNRAMVHVRQAIREASGLSGSGGSELQVNELCAGDLLTRVAAKIGLRFTEDQTERFSSNKDRSLDDLHDLVKEVLDHYVTLGLNKGDVAPVPELSSAAS